jgi:hypothetical protein
MHEMRSCNTKPGHSSCLNYHVDYDTYVCKDRGAIHPLLESLDAGKVGIAGKYILALSDSDKKLHPASEPAKVSSRTPMLLEEAFSLLIQSATSHRIC